MGNSIYLHTGLTIEAEKQSFVDLDLIWMFLVCMGSCKTSRLHDIRVEFPNQSQQMVSDPVCTVKHWNGVEREKETRFVPFIEFRSLPPSVHIQSVSLASRKILISSARWPTFEAAAPLILIWPRRENWSLFETWKWLSRIWASVHPAESRLVHSCSPPLRAANLELI